MEEKPEGWEPDSAFPVPLISLKEEVLQEQWELSTSGNSGNSALQLQQCGQGRQNQQDLVALVCLDPYMSSVEASRSK